MIIANANELSKAAVRGQTVNKLLPTRRTNWVYFLLVERLAKFFSSLDNVATAFAAVGIVLAALANWFNVEPAAFLGFAFLGAGIVGWSVDGLLNQHLPFFAQGLQVHVRVQGFLVRAWSILFAAVGFLLMGFGILSLLNPRTPVPARVQQFFATSQGIGILLIGGGMLGTLWALSMLFESVSNRSILGVLASLPRRLVGLALLLLSLALVLVGVLQIIAPALWDNLWRAFLP